MEKIVAIREEQLKKLILEIYDLRDKASKVFNDLEVLMSNSSSYFDSDDGKACREKFRLLSQNFPTFLSNMESYGEDLEKVIVRYHNLTYKNVDIFRKTLYNDVDNIGKETF